MNIRETVFNLQKVLDEMGETFSSFQKETGLTCPSGCGTCCLYPDIESTTLECLPLALKVYREGKLEEWLTRLENSDYVCIAWEGDRLTGGGRCTQYEARPSICRVFGASGYFDKNHNVALSICKLLKAAHPEIAQKFREAKAPESTPIIAQWYTRILALGSGDLVKRRPINEAIRSALQIIGLHAQYQELDI